ncbi:MAG: AAA family ATPase [Granulosicoccus sp.]
MNSRLRISNQDELAERAVQLQSWAARQGTRALLIVVSPPKSWLESFALSHQCDFLDAASQTDRADRISALLGTERCVVVMQLGKRPDLGLLAATAGTVKAGGLMVLGTCRPIQTNPPDNRDKTETYAKPDANHSHKRLERLASAAAMAHPQTVNCVELTSECDSTALSHPPGAPTRPVCNLNECNSVVHRHSALLEQDALLSRAFNHLTTNASSCIVIKGRRGRGKSSLLARLALQLDKMGLDCRITALHASALSSFQRLAGNKSIRYASAESASFNPADVLLVDEAANLSIKQLQLYLTCFRHVVFCTTIEGYEASGRAFDVRLLSDWSNRSMALLQLNVTQPWRWAEGDALESFIDQLLLNNPRQPVTPLPQWTADEAQRWAAECQPRKVSRNDLLDDETLLAGVHSLLHSTHYQTTTKDLEHLLDARTVQLWIQTLDNVVVGVLILEQEGGIHPSLQESILAKTRRLPNQLLPQLLAQTANNPGGLEKRYARIIRLAVTSKLRRQKLASDLLQAVTDECIQSKEAPSAQPPVAAIGASFAADDCSIGFWQSHGYTEFHRGFRSNPRTGKQAVAMLRSFESVTSEILSIAADIHHDNRLARTNSLLCSSEQPTEQAISSRDIQLLQRFATGQRSQHDTYAALRRLSMTTGLSTTPGPDKSARQHELDMRHYVKHWIESCAALL